MGKVTRQRPTVGPMRKRPLREVGILDKTRKRYLVMLQRFLSHLRDLHVRLPQTCSELDARAAAYMEELWQDDRPEGWAADLLSGIKRFVPVARKGLHTTTFLFNNWRRTVRRVRAMPLTPDIVKAMAGVAYLWRRPDLAAVLLCSFAGLLRFDELTHLQRQHFIFSPDRKQVVILLPESKSGHRNNTVEKVEIWGPLVVIAIRLAAAECRQPQVYLHSGQRFREELRQLGAALGLPTRYLTPYSLRRGGASWHFQAQGSISRTMVHGRWSAERTARIYIDNALAQLGEWQLTLRVLETIRIAAIVANALLAQHGSAAP